MPKAPSSIFRDIMRKTSKRALRLSGKPYNKIIGHHPGRMQRATEMAIDSDFTAGSSLNKISLAKKSFYNLLRMAGSAKTSNVRGAQLSSKHAKKIVRHLQEGAVREEIESVKSAIPKLMRISNKGGTFELYNLEALREATKTGTKFSFSRAKETLRHERLHRVFDKFFSDRLPGKVAAQENFLKTVLKDAYGTSDISRLPAKEVSGIILGSKYSKSKYAEEYIVRALSRPNLTRKYRQNLKPLVDVLSKDDFFKPIFNPTQGKLPGKHPVSASRMAKLLGDHNKGVSTANRTLEKAYKSALTAEELAQWGKPQVGQEGAAKILRNTNTAGLVGVLDKDKINHQIMDVKKKTSHLFQI